MAVPPAPPPLEHLGPRPFSFYPAIVNLEHNEWIYVKATWSEVQVVNTKSKEEIWVPRRFLGDISTTDDPIAIVGLLKEFEYRAGKLWPVERRLIEMPRVVNESPRPAVEPERSREPAPVVGIELGSRTENRVGRLIVGAVAASVAGCVLLVSVYRGELFGSHVTYTTVLQSNLDFTNQDDYFSVVRKAGPPASERWSSEKGALQYRVLSYPQLGYSVILMGGDRKSMHYIGSMNKDWRPIHSVDLANHVTSYDLLRSLPKF